MNIKNIVIILVIELAAKCSTQEVGCTGPHEHYTQCRGCPKTCQTLNRIPDCGIVCMEGCICDDGYVLNNGGVCVLPKDCSKCQGPNEFFNCGSACDRECATLGQTCPIVNIKCNDKCYCKDGFARDNSNICIPIKNCPVKKCPKNEISKTCGTACQRTCDNPTLKCTLKCVSGCFCRDGYIRKNKGGPCIKEAECPQS